MLSQHWLQNLDIDSQERSLGQEKKSHRHVSCSSEEPVLPSQPKKPSLGDEPGREEVRYYGTSPLYYLQGS